MPPLTYLSGSYTSADLADRERRATIAATVSVALIERGHLVLCPVTMNHEADRILAEKGLRPPSGYWTKLERRLAAASDRLVVIAAPGWEASRGVAREIALFNAARKSVEFVDELGRPVALNALGGQSAEPATGHQP